MVEPYITHLPAAFADKASLVRPGEAAGKADIIVLLVDHDDFKAMPAPAGKRIVDTRGVWTGRGR